MSFRPLHFLIFLTIGTLVSYLITCALFVVATNQMFSIVFAIVLIMLAMCFLWRLFTTTFTGESTPTLTPIRLVAWIGPIFLVVAAISALAVKKGTVPFLSHAEKVPLFGTLGAACSFAFSYSSLEILVLATLYLPCLATFGEEPAQFMRSLLGALVTSLVLGAVVGGVFAAMDGEDCTTSELLGIQGIAAVIGAALGGSFYVLEVYVLRGRGGVYQSIMMNRGGSINEDGVIPSGGNGDNIISLEDEEDGL
eukprot:PhF_6_TR9678/c0_g1_i1/m.14893